MRRSRLARDPIAAELAADNQQNMDTVKRMEKASKVLESRFTSKDDPS